MSKYTTEVRFICEQFSGLNDSVGLSGVNMVIEGARDKIFDFEYPIFDEEYRPVLETKILRHFYTREIGAETVGLWKLWLNTRMNEIMPYYNKLYKSELLDFNPLYDVDITKERTGTTGSIREEQGETTNTGNTIRTSGGTGENSVTHYDYYSETPQGGVGNLEDLTYLTNARKISDSGSNEYNDTTNSQSSISANNSVNSTINNTEDYLERVSGKQGGSNYSKMLEDYRKTFLNIDMKIINELNDLFMNLW